VIADLITPLLIRAHGRESRETELATPKTVVASPRSWWDTLLVRAFAARSFAECIRSLPPTIPRLPKCRDSMERFLFPKNFFRRFGCAEISIAVLRYFQMGAACGCCIRGGGIY
jgi:hypothetical protein